MAVNMFPPPMFEDAVLTGLRREVREFVTREIESGTFRPAVDSWMTGWDREFTLRLAGRGWLGMTIPVEYGGHGRSYLERFVVTEELLAAGAPVTAHWFADRQVAPHWCASGPRSSGASCSPHRRGHRPVRDRHE